ncbi:hypothetical protein SmJEL517_g04724 [Synchytrium microbalum]|uniref:EF-hand domain-containing protein n=1 Tax=Synchytrium microbalum TaxID=1806994 RepID=A0A507C3K1_9FUNG|nr:uncharacterized protein SmJEL517_g04724 [Synchytrium microbalum]TPX32135.1 hypothetical protein SmJEL517_g04724 [Synchytrium microbalum]
MAASTNKITILPNSGKPRTLSAVESFGISALSPACAVIFTNPFDTAKVRLQLQGQGYKAALATAGKDPAAIALVKKNHLVYTNSFQTIYKIFMNEGIKGLQKGLTPALLRESSKNLFRIGMYEPIMSVLHDPQSGPAPGWKRMLAGSMCGVMGAFSCNPFELVKTRLQSKSSGKSVAVGTQHSYKGVWDALRSIYVSEGLKGLYRGSVLSMGRSVVGSGSNLASYSMIKEWLQRERGWADSAWTDMAAGLASGVVSCLFMSPIDVTRTRYYNQPYVDGKGTIYTSGFDAVKKIFAQEGPGAFYKGLITQFLRIGPHFCLTFVFLGIFRRSLLDRYDNQDLKESFATFDSDGDNFLNVPELSNALQTVIPPPKNMSRADYSRLIQLYTDRVIEVADVDHDHKISFIEYKYATKEVRSIVRELQLQSAFQFFAHKHEKIDVNDLKLVLKEMGPRSQNVTEAEHELIIAKNAEALIKLADKDMDGKVSFEEFTAVADHVDLLSNHKILREWGRSAQVKIVY